MSTESAYEWLTDFMGMAFVQPGGPATITYPLLCHLIGDTDEPEGDVTTTLCRTADGKWETAHRSQGAPSSATLSFEVWLSKTRLWLQRLKNRRCPFPIYIHHSECPPWDVFDNYDSGQVFKWPFITSRGQANVGLQRGEEGQAQTQTNQTYELSAEPDAPEYWKLVHTRRTITEDQPLRDIAFCNAARCVTGCGDLEDECKDGVIVCDAATAIADVWFTTDYGVTWIAATAQPFDSGEDVNSVVCFYTGRDAVRHIAMRGSVDTGSDAEVAYTDDAGGTAWTNVPLATSASEYGMHSGGLFALDQNHIWAVTSGCSVFFSDDAGVTWTDQAAPGTQELYYVHFIDERYGWCVGDARYMLYTTDGGDHWSVPTNTAGAADDVYTCVATIDRNRAFVGGRDTGATAALFYYTTDAGTTWTSYLARLELAVDGGTITHIGDVMFYDEFAGAVTGTWNDGTSDYKGTWRTINGGWDWEFYYDDGDAFDTTTQEYQGGNAVWICNYNQIFSVGAPSDSTGTVEELSALGSV
jgi:hypothetical protein